MRHGKRTFKIGRTGSHRRALVANMLKSLIVRGRIETTVAKAKEIRRYADKMITLAKKDTLASQRDIQSRLRLCYNKLTTKESRQAKKGDLSSYNDDRKVIKQLIDLKIRFKDRNGGYTRIIRMENRVGDNAPKCLLEYLS